MVYRHEPPQRGPQHDPIPPELDRLGKEVVDAAYTVLANLGPGLLESVYEACLAHELTKRGIPVETQVAMPVTYDGAQIDAGFRVDVLVDRRIVVELKAVEEILGIHQAQLLTYLKLSGIRLGYLINFNVTRFRNGIKRMVV